MRLGSCCRISGCPPESRKVTWADAYSTLTARCLWTVSALKFITILEGLRKYLTAGYMPRRSIFWRRIGGMRLLLRNLERRLLSCSSRCESETALASFLFWPITSHLYLTDHEDQPVTCSTEFRTYFGLSCQQMGSPNPCGRRQVGYAVPPKV